MQVAKNPCAQCGGIKYVGDGTICGDCSVAREKKAQASYRAWARRIENVYGISDESYLAILEYQGGRCAICLRVPRTKRLAVDHDHAVCPDGVATPESIRGLLCRQCNREVLGHLRDDPEALQRAIDYLKDPPARKVLHAENATGSGDSNTTG